MPALALAGHVPAQTRRTLQAHPNAPSASFNLAPNAQTSHRPSHLPGRAVSTSSTAVAAFLQLHEAQTETASMLAPTGAGEEAPRTRT